MARYLIRPVNGGESRIVGDAALPFLQGYVIIDVLDDGDDSPLYLSREQSDFLYAQLGDIANADSPTGTELRAFLESKVDRTGAVAGQVPTLQADGTLAFAPGGGGGGAVSSVNGLTGDITLDPAPEATSGATGTVRLTGDLGGTAQNPTTPFAMRPVFNLDSSDPARPNTQASVLFVCPDTDRPATNGSKTGGTYAGTEGDFMATGTF